MTLPDSALTDPVSVVRGEAEPEELAALVAVLVSRSASVQTRPEPTRRAGWGRPAAALRRPLQSGPGAWSRSLR